MNREEVLKIIADAREKDERPDLRGANLRGVDLRGVDLRWVDLRGANLRWVDLDFSCWPLWCGSRGVIIDVRIAAQLAAHGAVVKVERSDDCSNEQWQAVIEWQAACEKLGKFSHRAKDLGLI